MMENADIDLNWLDVLIMFGAACDQEDVRKVLYRDIKIRNKEELEAMEKEIREKQSCAVSKPNGCCSSYYFMNQIPCFQEASSYQKDCYYFAEEQDMGAHIPSCNCILEIEGYEPKNCNENCPNYITHEQVNQLVKEHLVTRKEIEDIKNGCT